MGVGLLGQDDTEAYYRALKRPNTALLIGNGVNLANPEVNALSWQSLVFKLAQDRGVALSKEIIEKAALTELADILSLCDTGNHDLRRDAIANLRKGKSHSPEIASFAYANSMPILTTNFDLNLANPNLKHNTTKRKFLTNSTGRFSIPAGWSVFRGESSDSAFARSVPGLWHVHGVFDIPSSLRLTSASLIRAISKSQDLIHAGGLYANLKCDIATCNGCVQCSWAGQRTWLDIFFHRNLVIIGFEFGKSEIFLRSLAIERYKYLRHRYGDPAKVPYSYFIVPKNYAPSSDEVFFFENLGFKTLVVPTTSAIYNFREKKF